MYPSPPTRIEAGTLTVPGDSPSWRVSGSSSGEGFAIASANIPNNLFCSWLMFIGRRDYPRPNSTFGLHVLESHAVSDEDDDVLLASQGGQTCDREHLERPE